MTIGRPKLVAAEQTRERTRQVLEAVQYMLAVFQPAAMIQSVHLGDRRVESIREVVDEQALQDQPGPGAGIGASSSRKSLSWTSPSGRFAST